jgi:hypothetical protein
MTGAPTPESLSHTRTELLVELAVTLPESAIDPSGRPLLGAASGEAS